MSKMWAAALVVAILCGARSGRGAETGQAALEGAPAARGDETFLDAADGAWYTAAVRWAAGEGHGQAVRVSKYIKRDAELGDMIAKHAKAPK